MRYCKFPATTTCEPSPWLVLLVHTYNTYLKSGLTNQPLKYSVAFWNWISFRLSSLMVLPK